MPCWTGPGPARAADRGRIPPHVQLTGMGFRLVDAIGRREYIIVQGLVLVIALGYVLANFLVDVLYGVIDPRVRHA